MRVVCTAGHVDHGKSSLVRALTGMEPDRFAEERRRGLTIDLGFAWADLGGHTVAFVDLPGHERFIANMLAGAGPVETALFVVAADEGWKPQSQEHLDILSLLGTSHGVVAITRADLAPDGGRATAADVAARLAGGPLAGAPVVCCSAVTGAGLDELRGALGGVLAAAPDPREDERPRLWVDRSFTVRGAGTVVTGTLTGGGLRVGEELALLPGDRRGRVRGLQSLGSQVDAAAPGARVAVNLSGVDRTEAQRGDALVRPGHWVQAAALEAWVRVLPGERLDRRGAWHLHAGSARRLCAVVPVAGRALTDEGFVRLELDEPLALQAGDRFVLREAGRWRTVAGGLALDVLPPAPARGRTRVARVEQLETRRRCAGRPAELLVLHVRERVAARTAVAAAAVGLPLAQAADAARAHRLLTLGDWLVHAGAAAAWTEASLDALSAHHVRHPMEPGAPRDLVFRAVAAAGCPTELAQPFVDTLVSLGRVVSEGPALRHPAHEVVLDDAQSGARDALLAALEAQPLAPPGLREAMAAAGAGEALVRELERRGRLIRLTPDLAFTAGAVDAAVARLREAFAGRPFTASDARQAWGTTRKYALPLLEELDRRRVTARSGDQRVLSGTP